MVPDSRSKTDGKTRDERQSNAVIGRLLEAGGGDTVWSQVTSIRQRE